RDILLPVWDQRRGQGSWFQYRVERFARVRLTDYLLTGQGWLSFEYRGEARCYDTAPQAFPQSLSTPEDVPLPIVIDGIDEEGQALSYAVIESPRHGRLEGQPPELVYLPDPGFNGADSFRFRVSDGDLDSAPATVDIQVTPVND